MNSVCQQCGGHAGRRRQPFPKPHPGKKPEQIQAKQGSVGVARNPEYSVDNSARAVPEGKDDNAVVSAVIQASILANVDAITAIRKAIAPVAPK